MAFRIKDLLINVMPPATGKEGNEDGGDGCGCTATVWCECTHFSPTITLGGCGWTNWCGCTFVSPTTHTTPWTGWVCELHAQNCMGTPTLHQPPWHFPAGHGADPDAAAKQLSAMKAQLKQSLAEIEEHEKRFGERSQLQTIEEIEALEDKLREALKELERRKSDLKKR